MSICPLIGYTPPVLKKNYSIGEFIEYTVYNPISNKLERQRIKLTRLSTHFNNKTQYRQQVAVMINSLNAKLASGWTPFGETQTVAEFTPLREAIERYLRDKGRDLRKASMVSYKSVADILLDWLTSKDMDQMASHLFNHRLAISFMDHLIERPKFNNNTYNTYLKKYRACFAWMVEHGYSKENPFEKIKTRQKQEKIRTLIPVEYRDIVINHVRTSEHPNYELVMHLVFTSLIRPSEIERLQVRDVDLMKKCIHIPGSKAKTHKDRDAALSDACIAMLIPLLAKPGVKPDWYLIDSNYECGEKPCYHGMFKKHWMKIRTDCKLPKEMQLYSLKDSGITEMLNAGVSVNAVKEAAGHADISTTNKYVGKDTEKMIEAVRGAHVGLGTNKTDVAQAAGHADMSVTKEYETDSAALITQVRVAQAVLKMSEAVEV